MTSGDATGRRTPLVKPTPLALMVLSLLFERPMHPYEMQRVMTYRGKDQIVNVQRGSLYPMVERLVNAGLVEPAETERDGRRPERTIYRLTEDGRETVHDWLEVMLREPKKEFPEFPAALAFMPVLNPSEARSQLKGRILNLEAQLASMRTGLRQLSENFGMPRLFVIEDEFRLAMLQAELDWVQAVVADLASGDLDWSAAKIRDWVDAIEAKTGQIPGGSR